MKRYLIIGILVLICSDVISCSGFVFKNEQNLFLCASLDQMALHGYIIVNKRNIEKYNFLANGQKVLRWTSKYGSVTFSAIGKEFPYGGMNEKGLTVAIMTTDPMEYPKDDNRFEINESEWVQYILDNFSTTKEVLESDSKIRVKSIFDIWHYLLCDQNGNIAIIEFQNGKMKAYSGSGVKIPVLENTLYQKSLKNYKNDMAMKRLTSRFSTAAYLLEKSRPSDTDASPIKKMFSILDQVKQEITKYQIVYDIKNKKIEFKATTFKYLTDKSSKDYSRGISEGSLSLNDIDFNGIAMAAKLGIIGVPNEPLLPFSKVFDNGILNYTLGEIKSQKSKDIPNEIIEKYIQFAKKD